MSARLRAEVVTALQARDQFADLLGRAAHGKERVVISRHRKAVAALVPIEDLDLLESMEDRRAAVTFKRAKAEFVRSSDKPVPWKKLKKDLALG